MSAHRCLAGPACRRAATVDGQRRPAATAIAETLCPACDKHIGSAIRQLPDDFAELRNAIGEHSTTDGPKIHSTPSPKIPISARREALMSSIVDTADRAATVVADRLHTDWDTTGRKPPPEAREGSIAWCAAHRAQPATASTIKAAIALVEPNLRILAAAPAEAHIVWETRGYKLDYDDKPFRHVELTGIDIALALVDLHHQTRAELGKTRLRHTYAMPCPDCGSRVHRNDGESIVICDGTAHHSFTETDYKVRAGLILEERTWTEMSNWLLAEAYWRLDRMQTLIDNMAKDPEINRPGAGPLVLETLQQILHDGPELDGKAIGHKRPWQRELGSSRRAATQRQVDEDNWTWRNEKPTRPTRRRIKPRPPYTGPKIAEASRTTLIDIDIAAINDGIPCGDCNLYHAGDCL